MVAELNRLSKDAVQTLEAFAQFIKGGAQKDFVPPHGEGGLLTYPGVRPDMYSLVPRVGTFAASLPMYKSRFQTEIFEFLTGVTAQSGTNPDDTCGTPPQSGQAKIAQIIATYGTFYKATPEINAANAGKLKNRADLRRRLRNPPFEEMTANPFVPMPVGAGPESFNTMLGKTFLEFGQGAMLDFAYTDWRGDKTKTSAQTQLGFIREYDGIDKWIKTGWTDVVSGATVASLDSQVVAYNATLGSDFVLALSNLIRTLVMEAELKNTPNATWDIVVHPRAKFALFDIWACNYQTARCLPTESNGLRLDVEGITRLRDEMYRGNYLLIDGERFRVMTDAGIQATQAEGGLGLWTSDVYIVPREDGMGNALTYREYLPRDFASNDELAEIFGQAFGELRVMNDGLYMGGFVKRSAFCFTWYFTADVRLILERPDLAGRIDDVSFTSQTPFTDPFPGATYHRNGGTTFRV